MVLSFNKLAFKYKILEESKIHTIRKDSEKQWHEGMDIHFWLGVPGKKESNPTPHQFATGKAKMVLEVYIHSKRNIVLIGGSSYGLQKAALEKFAINDGFRSWEEMKAYFPEEGYYRIIYFKEVKDILNNQLTIF
ncbi:hypothetical protein [Brumimicrobium mesophilum]|uniref:hypothetical protein n=1 Tax=Brumimicrobium mesophilum TaxID=392717 RepID=UPI000D1428EE|nr:hypothetical protein [Brumimicrobium mesophilum]